MRTINSKGRVSFIRHGQIVALISVYEVDALSDWRRNNDPAESFL